MPPVICIVGKSKKEKSRLMESLIKELGSRGLKVGALKRHKHGDFDIDIEGKDSWRYSRAGADTVAISSPEKFAIIKQVDEEMDIQEICDMYFAESDLVLADGYTLSGKPRIIVGGDVEVFGRGCEVVAVVEEGFEDVAGVVGEVVGFVDV